MYIMYDAHVRFVFANRKRNLDNKYYNLRFIIIFSVSKIIELYTTTTQSNNISKYIPIML